MTDGSTRIVAGVPREAADDEYRVALVPAGAGTLIAKGVDVVVESGAGSASGFSDDQYTAAGAKIVSGRDEVFSTADIVLQVRAAGACRDHAPGDRSRIRDGQVVIASCDPLSEPGEISAIADTRATCFALELLPRITRAQSMDILSSMATVAGYKAVLIAAGELPRMFPLLMTAAGTIAPARVLVVGAGVAGLQAIATAKRLGAVVYGYDIRPAVREQVESLGGKFVELEIETGESEQAGGYARQMDEEFYRKQRELMAKVVAECNVVITTAAIPGKAAPILVTREMVDGMASGSVVVDLAAERGGNCELTEAGRTIEHQGVRIIGPVNLPAGIPYHASEMYSKNISTFLLNMIKDGQLDIDLNDEIVRDTLVTRNGDVVHNRIRELLNLEPLTPPEPATDEGTEKP